MHLADYSIVLFFLGLMVFIGVRMRNSSANFGDYVRMGSRSTWWLGGSSIFMGTFSAITFTGICGSAYLAGWSVLIIFWCNALMFGIQAFIFAPLLRRTRADTPQDALRLRFGPIVEQVQSYIGSVSSFIWGGTFLLGLATFLSVLFGIPLWIVIIGVGGVVLFYSVAGGSWSVQITDALQAIILLPVTIAFAALCLYRIGGIDGFFLAIEQQGLAGDFALLKSPGHVYQSPIPVEKGMFTPLWCVAMVFNAMVQSASLQTSFRYLSLKDERSASKAAGLAAILMICGSLIWFIPAIVGRLLFSNQVEAVEGLSNRSDAAYAVTALEVLPPGFLGLIVVAMLAATMSSMDTFLTGSAATIVKNIYLPLMRALGKRSFEGKSLMRFTQGVNLLLGLWAIVMAFLLHRFSGSGGIFGIMMNTFALIGPPVAMPVALGLLTKRIPLWGFFSGVGVGFAMSLTIFILQKSGTFITWYEKMALMSVASLVPPLLSTFFWERARPSYHAHVRNFFETIRRPVIVQDEVDGTVDANLLRTVGIYVLVSAVAVSVLVFFTGTTEGAVAVVSVGGVMFLTGGAMTYFGRERPPVEEVAPPAHSPDESNVKRRK
jgi:Na+/proline symporter